MKKWDYYIIIICILISAVGLLIVNIINSEGSRIVVDVDGIEYGVYSLDEDMTIDISTNNGVITNTLVIEDGKAFMSMANCPDKVCVRQGTISKNHESICCAPNHVIATIISDDVGQYDAITQ